MHQDMQRYYSRNKFFLSQIGGWPFQSKKLKVLLSCLLLTIQISFLAVKMLQFYDTWGNIKMTIENTIIITVIAGSIMKLINIYVNNNKLRRLLQLMDNHWRLFRNQCELYTLRDYADTGRRITKYYAVYLYMFVMLRIIMSLMPQILDVIRPLNESRPLKYIIEIDRIDKEKYYYPMFLYSCVGIISTISVIVNVDTIYVIYVLHACSLFRAIGIRLKNIINKTNIERGERRNNQKDNDLQTDAHNLVTYTEDYSEMMICLKKHQLVLEYVCILDSAFTYVTLFSMLLNIMVMSLIGIQFINKVGYIDEIIRSLFIAVISFTHLLCICFPGQLLIDRSSEVFDRAYSSQWYTFTLKTRRLLRMLLYRSIVPSTLSAGKIYTMSMAMYSSVIRTAISYFTAFLSLR